MKKIRFAFIIVVLAAIFHFVPWFEPAEVYVVRGFLGIGGALRSTALNLGGFVDQVFKTGDIAKENLSLKTQIQALNEKQAAADALIAENLDLQELLNFQKRTDLALVPAEVIGADPDATVRAIIINRGSEAGLRRGDPVIVGDGTLVGKIERAVAGRSTVLLPTDSRSAIAVMAADHPEANGVAQGEKGLVVSMSLIPQHAPLVAGDLVVTTGREAQIPRGLVLGKIESVNAMPADPFMSATVVPAVDPIDLTRVAVITSK